MSGVGAILSQAHVWFLNAAKLAITWTYLRGRQGRGAGDTSWK